MTGDLLLRPTASLLEAHGPLCKAHLVALAVAKKRRDDLKHKADDDRFSARLQAQEASSNMIQFTAKPTEHSGGAKARKTLEHVVPEYNAAEDTASISKADQG